MFAFIYIVILHNKASAERSDLFSNSRASSLLLKITELVEPQQSSARLGSARLE